MTSHTIFDLIAASGPLAEHAEKLMLYGQFVGAWEVEATWYGQNGRTRTGRGEWHFAWILGGRGVQDVLFGAGASPDRYGTTLRCYDPSLDAWHISWMQPQGGEFVHLLGRQAGEDIVQEGSGSDPARLERWSFTAITPASFLWKGEVSLDNGETWTLEQEMRAMRREE